MCGAAKACSFRFQLPIFLFRQQLETRTTFETPKYPRRPRDQYTAQIVNTLELSDPAKIEVKKTYPTW